MKLSTQIWKGNERGDQRVGDIWTNGKTVFYSPDNELMRRIVNSKIPDYLDPRWPSEDVGKVSQAEPERFVRNLPYFMRDHYMWATEVIIEP